MQLLKLFRYVAVAAATLTALVSQTSLAASEKYSPDSPEGLINLLYKNYAWEAIGDIDGIRLQSRELPELRKYFTDTLAAQIRNDQECVIKTGDMCRLDGDIIFDTQDPIVFDLTILPVSKHNEVEVSYKYPPDKKKIIKFKMARTDQGWRIADILYDETHYSLRTILSGKR